MSLIGWLGMRGLGGSRRERMPRDKREQCTLDRFGLFGLCLFLPFLVLTSNFIDYTARIHSAPKICTKPTLRPICRKRSRPSTPDSRLLMRKTPSLRRLCRRRDWKLNGYCRILDWSFRILRVLLRQPRNSADNITFARTRSRWMRRRKPVRVCDRGAETVSLSDS